MPRCTVQRKQKKRPMNGRIAYFFLTYKEKNKQTNKHAHKTFYKTTVQSGVVLFLLLLYSLGVIPLILPIHTKLIKYEI